MENNLPDISSRIKSIIDDKFNGNVRQFCLAMGLDNSAKVNRLFLIDKRNGAYPMPSSDMLLLVSNTFNVSLDWLYKGEERNNNDINISNQEYIDIIKQQQEQINNLINLLGRK